MAAAWTDDFFSEAGQRIGVQWLRVWIQVIATMFNMGLVEAEMSSCSAWPRWKRFLSSSFTGSSTGH
jgi:hypothetical protein